MTPNKYFIITIDTEGDNLWDYRGGDITVKNAAFIPRFQTLCEKFSFRPVYLVNYEMACDPFLSEYLKNAAARGCCETGIHPHAWNNPPRYELKGGGEKRGLPYLIEYPEDIMRQKIGVLYNKIHESFGTYPVSHRAGRWAADETYFKILREYGIKTDCSVTPHVSWKKDAGFTEGAAGTDYSAAPEEPYMIYQDILETPVTIRKIHYFTVKNIKKPRSWLSAAKRFAKGSTAWLRPSGSNLDDMTALIRSVQNSDSDYIMFMLHSSELMPGGSPAFPAENDIEVLYHHLNVIFEKIAAGFTGATLAEYYDIYRKKEIKTA